MRPTWGQVRQFCIAQGYAERRGDHDRYFKVVGGRHSSGAMISHGVDGETVPSQMWLKIWKRQLLLASEDEFWKELDGHTVLYDIPSAPEPQRPLPVTRVPSAPPARRALVGGSDCADDARPGAGAPECVLRQPTSGALTGGLDEDFERAVDTIGEGV